MNFTPLLQNKIIEQIEILTTNENSGCQTFALITLNDGEKDENYEKDSYQFFTYIREEINKVENIRRNKVLYLLSCEKSNEIINRQTFLLDLLYRNHYNVHACNKSNQFIQFRNLKNKKIKELEKIITCFENLFENFDDTSFSTIFIEKLINFTQLKNNNNFHVELNRFLNWKLNSDKKQKINNAIKKIRQSYNSFLCCNVYKDVDKINWKNLLKSMDDLIIETKFIEIFITMIYMWYLISQNINKFYIIQGDKEITENINFLIQHKICKTKDKKMFRHMEDIF
jgi:hypothetical protein